MLEAEITALFDQKPETYTEEHFGLFAPDTARLARKYLRDRTWLQDAIFGSRV